MRAYSHIEIQLPSQVQTLENLLKSQIGPISKDYDLNKVWSEVRCRTSHIRDKFRKEKVDAPRQVPSSTLT